MTTAVFDFEPLEPSLQRLARVFHLPHADERHPLVKYSVGKLWAKLLAKTRRLMVAGM